MELYSLKDAAVLLGRRYGNLFYHVKKGNVKPTMWVGIHPLFSLEDCKRIRDEFREKETAAR